MYPRISNFLSSRSRLVGSGDLGIASFSPKASSRNDKERVNSQSVLRQIVRNFGFPFVLIAIELVIFFTNYIPGTYLVGWDNVMPEFNIGLNFKRSLFQVWQEYRGLGLLDGMAHTANLVHTVYIWALSFILPQSSLRYVFLLITHAVGGVAFYYLMRHVIPHSMRDPENKAWIPGQARDDKARPYRTIPSSVAFLGALVYMFNLGVLQMYYAPLEVFAFHFAALPLLSLFVIRALEVPSRKNLLLVFAGSFLTSPQGFVPTVFLVYLLFLFSILVVFSFSTKQVKRALLVGFIVLAANAFWLMPFVYSATQNAATVQKTRINQFSSEEIYYRNRAYGDIQSILTFKGFMVESIEYDVKTKRYVYFMEVWKKQSERFIFMLSTLLLCMTALYGIIESLRQRRVVTIPFLAGLILSFFFIANDTIIFAQANELFRWLFPTLGEVFRFPFTKFITLYAFCISVFFSIGLSLILAQLKKRFRYVLFAVVCGFVLFLSYPVFAGNFFSPLLRLSIPKEYFSLMQYFSQQDENSRIAVLPAHTFWNWQYRSWGHRGSGFLWHGVPQPMLERAFDPWSNYNEQFYNELSYAITSENMRLFTDVLRKYDVKYLLLDQYLENTLLHQPINYDSLRRFLETNENIEKKQTFGSLIVYQVTIPTQWVYTFDEKKIARVYPRFGYEKEDAMLINKGDYILDTKSPTTISLFPSFYTEKVQEDREFSAVNGNDVITITPKNQITAPLSQSFLQVPSMFATEYLIPVAVRIVEGTIALRPIYPTIFINGQPIIIEDDPLILQPEIIQNPTSVTFVDLKHTITIGDKNDKSYLLQNFPNSIKVSGDGVEEIIIVDTRYVSQKPFSFQLTTDKITSIQVEVPKVRSPLAAEYIHEQQKFTFSKQEDTLNPFHKNGAFARVLQEKGGKILEAKSNTAELSYYKNNLYHQGSYILFADIEYKSGLPLNFYIDNTYQHRAEVEGVFSKTSNDNIMVIPPTENYFQGYGLHFVVKSIGTEIAKSKIKSLHLYPFPAETIRNMHIAQGVTNSETVQRQTVPFTKQTPFLYTITHPKVSQILVLSQAYNLGWNAYVVPNSAWSVFAQTAPFLVGVKQEHVLVNNWANGWEIDKDAQENMVVLLFWPQYLTIIGELVSIGVLLYIFIRNKRLAA